MNVQRPGAWARGWDALRRRVEDLPRPLLIGAAAVLLLALSAIPNPVFEFAGITAGAVRMRF